MLACGEMYLLVLNAKIHDIRDIIYVYGVIPAVIR